MKYDVTFSCGHSGVVELFGNGKHREDKLAWYEKCGLCPECWKKQQEEKIKEKSKGLVALTGSPKQIAWAEKIRIRKIDAVTQYLKEIILLTNENHQKVVMEQSDLIMIDLKAKNEARFWIDVRDSEPESIIEKLLLINESLKERLYSLRAKCA